MTGPKPELRITRRQVPDTSRLKQNLASDDSTYAANRKKLVIGTDDPNAEAMAKAAFSRGSARADSLARFRASLKKSR